MLTYEQATDPNSREFWHMTAQNRNGTPLRARRNGKTQVWKTRPTEFSLPVKYGLRECFTITEATAHEWCLSSNWPVESELFRGVKP